MTSSEDVLLQVPHVKHKKDDGTLYVMSERLAWIQGHRDTVTLSHQYADIKSQKISPEGKPKIQLQIVLQDNSTFTFHFVNPGGLGTQFRERDQVKELLIQLLPKFQRKVNRELEEKNRLLSENPTLLQLYKDLVIDGIVSSDEFWTVHAQQYIAQQKPPPPQGVGVSSGFLSGIQPETDGANGIRYNLTTDVIESIFKTYPAVRRKHIECVPAQMTESIFWTKFFQSHYFHRDRLPLPKELFSDCAKADDKEMRRELDKLRLLNNNVIAILEGSERVDNNEKDMCAPESKDTVTPQGIHRNMIKRFNQHSIMVLKACERVGSTGQPTAPAAAEPSKKNGKKGIEEVVPVIENGSSAYLPPEAKKAKIVEKVVYEDLEGATTSNFQALNLTRVDRYLNGPIPDHRTDVVGPEQVTQATLQMRECLPRWGGKPQLLDAVTAVKILGELRPGGALMKAQTENTTQSLPPDVETDLRNLYISLCELLRHFWACFPPTTPALEEKLIKTYDTLKKFEQVKLQQMRDRLLRDHLSASPVLSHVTSVLNSAYSKYNLWSQRNRR